MQPHCAVQSKWRRMSYSTLQPHSCLKIFPQDPDSLKYIEISIFFMLWLQISMLAINYIYTPIKCNHCTLGEENYRYSSFFYSFIVIFLRQILNYKISLGIILYGRPTIGQLLPFHRLRVFSVVCGPYLVSPICQCLWAKQTDMHLTLKPNRCTGSMSRRLHDLL